MGARSSEMLFMVCSGMEAENWSREEVCIMIGVLWEKHFLPSKFVSG
jgi:hypothetical protein